MTAHVKGSLIVVLFVIPVWAAVLSADTVVTTNGTQYTGTVEEQADGYHITLSHGGSMVLPKSMVKSVMHDSPTQQAAIRVNQKVYTLLEPLRDCVTGCKSQVSTVRVALKARQEAEIAQDFSPEDIKKIDLAKDMLERIKSAIDSLGKLTPYPNPQVKNERTIAVSISFTAPDGAEKTIMITPKTKQSVLRSAQSDVTTATSVAKRNAVKRHGNQHRAEMAEYARLMTMLKNVDSMIEAVRDPLAAVVDDQAKSKEILTRLETEVDSSLQDVRGALERLGSGIPAVAQPAGTPATATATGPATSVREAAIQTAFTSGCIFFIWREEKEPVKGEKNALGDQLVFTVACELNPAKKWEPYCARIDVPANDERAKKSIVFSGTTHIVDQKKDEKSGFVPVIFTPPGGTISGPKYRLGGSGHVLVYLIRESDSKNPDAKPISNILKVPITFDK